MSFLVLRSLGVYFRYNSRLIEELSFNRRLENEDRLNVESSGISGLEAE